MVALNQFYEHCEHFCVGSCGHPHLIKRQVLLLSYELLLQVLPVHPFILFVEVDILQFARQFQTIAKELLDLLFEDLHLIAPQTAYPKRPVYAINKTIEDVAFLFRIAHSFDLFGAKVTQKYLEVREESFGERKLAIVEGSLFHSDH